MIMINDIIKYFYKVSYNTNIYPELYYYNLFFYLFPIPTKDITFFFYNLLLTYLYIFIRSFKLYLYKYFYVFGTFFNLQAKNVPKKCFGHKHIYFHFKKKKIKNFHELETHWH